MGLLKFDIPHRSRCCIQGNEPFSSGMDYFSVLLPAAEKNKEGFQRKDFCAFCWEKIFKNNPDSFRGQIYWKSTVPSKKKEMQSSIQRNEKALQLLEEILQRGDSEEAGEAFVLALFLSRNKLLELKQEIPNETGAVLLYEAVEIETMLTVAKVDLSSIEAQKIQSILAQKLNRPLSKPALFEKTVDFSADLSANFEDISKDMAEKLTDKDAKKSCFSEQMRFRKRSNI